MIHFAAFATALLLALALTPVVRLLAWRKGYVARPRADRWHRRSTALLGGIAVWLATLGGLLAAGVPPVPLLVLGVAAFGVFVVGLVDDLVTLTPATKITFQVVAASIALAGGIRLEWTPWQSLDSVLTVLWFIGLTNAFNLLDNMDGVCAGVGVIAAGALVAVGVWGGMPDPLSAAWAAALAGALAGFLVFNFRPATIFLGDSGSLFIGFMLAGLTALARGRRGPGFSAVALPVLIALVPIFDTTLVTVARKLSGRPASQGGTDHTTHRLVALGLSEPWAVGFIYLLSALGGIGAVMMSRAGSGAEVVVVLLAVVTLLLAVALLRVRAYGDADFSLLVRGRTRSIVFGALLRHHVFELLTDVGLIAVAYYASYWLRFGRPVFSTQYFETFLTTLPLVVACYVLGLWLSGTYAGNRRGFGAADFLHVAKGVGFGLVTSAMLLAYIYRFEDISRGALAIHLGLSVLFVTASRFVLWRLNTPNLGGGRQAVAYGAGTLGRMLAQELAQNRDLGYRLVGFIDDDVARVGESVLGVPVVGGLSHLEAMIADGAGAVILATRKLPKDVVRRLQDLCTDAGIPLLEFLCVLRDVPTLGAVHVAADERPVSSSGQAPATTALDGRVPLIRHVEAPAVERARPGSWAVPKA